MRLLMIVSAGPSAFMMWGFYAWQPYFLELLDSDAVWVSGVVSALVALATIAGNGVVEYFARFCGRRTTLLLAASAVLDGRRRSGSGWSTRSGPRWCCSWSRWARWAS